MTRAVTTVAALSERSRRHSTLRLVRHRLTPRQLDDALDAAGWPTWTGRTDGCPLVLGDVDWRARLYASRRGVAIPAQCLQVLPAAGAPGDWQALLVELTAVAPGAMTDLVRRDLIHEADGDGGTVRHLLGIEVDR